MGTPVKLHGVVRPTVFVWQVHEGGAAALRHVADPAPCAGRVGASGFRVWPGWRGERAGRGMLLGCRLKP